MRRLSPSFLLTFNKSMERGDSCSREQLCSEIHFLYKESFDFYFASLSSSSKGVNSIKKDVLVGVFSLSPLKLSSSLGDRHKNGFSHFVSPIWIGFCCSSRKRRRSRLDCTCSYAEFELCSIFCLFGEIVWFSNGSPGVLWKMSWRVRKLFKWNLIDSRNTIVRPTLLRKLEPLVRNRYVFDFLSLSSRIASLS